MNNLPATQQTAETTAQAWSERSGSIAKLAAALSKAQAKIEAAKKDSNNPFFKSKYADLSSVWSAIREPLTANELAILQEPGAINGKVLLTTTLLHSSGEYVRSSFEIPVTKQDPQGFGSAITYARRYALQAIVGIAPEDDDGNMASQRVQPAAPRGTQSTPEIVPADALPAPKMFKYDLSELPDDDRIPLDEWMAEKGCKLNELGHWESAKEIKKLFEFLVPDISKGAQERVTALKARIEDSKKQTGQGA